ncbi:Aspartate aminotransferase [Alkalibacterium sp. AK22]|uniref:MalY/PatB family protein n=1 Tax=Alkalibacterium sp. AK22 TaxID=1229520 RepID=UPI00044A03E3|nr:MalY/PatB family protein [Alkalibacterium sp. AK22]EXJ24485.1 Aspartate aminotransferase [Alkalibacterium sp. AK22]
MSFDNQIDRKNTGSVKWDKVRQLFGREDALAMWIADMDFENPPAVKKALEKLSTEAVLGYTFPTDSLYKSIIQWQDDYHGMSVSKKDILFSPSVLSSIAVVIQALTLPEDSILIHDPVYTPFYTVPRQNDRQVFRSPLLIKEGQYVMDLDDIEKQFQEHEIKLFVLSNPHNPGGRVWSETELADLVDLCIRYGVYLISDEIHSDLVYSNLNCTSPVTLNPSYTKWIVTLHSASKTFNLAGVKASFMIVFDTELRQKIKKIQHQSELHILNTFGMAATEAAFAQSQQWQRNLINYLEENRSVITDYFDTYLPDVSYMVPESTYLFWFETSSLGISDSRLKKHFAERGNIALNDGISYGPSGKGYMRLNFSVPRHVLLDALNRIRQVFSTPRN